ncbi:phage minor head protein [Candidatus Viridilinea mediisalina]|uniref:Phage head morphogenesis domain-containing protein n=1 Tax=Candidatus Viridilinea mediisalina TaxID=2024553 RepID=A0A2A6RHB2_9CHLR|nr:phage minor head protein [Candidatus Viridilinea mediisalina]PDW02286.1 hypothetical protein CJ255_14755 [Candidatus Viridilinea mediisalina]
MTATVSELDATAAAFRAALLRRDEAALRRLMAAYQPAYAAIQREVAVLTAQIAAARAAGETIRPAWLRERGRLEVLERQIVQEWARFAATAEQVITQTQREAVVAAVVEAAALTQAALDEAGLPSRLAVGGSVTRLPTEATAALVGVLGDGSPLRGLLDALGQEAAASVEAALLRGVTIGRNPRQTARDIRTALGGNLTRALTIARTEHLRAYRGATLERFRDNADILRGWQWRASPSARTCAVCLAMDGREFGLNEAMPTHPNCRCTQIPLLRDRPAPTRTLGADWFADQDEATQRRILGPGAFDLYRSGRITLGDLVGVRNDPRWGPTIYRRSLGDVRGENLSGLGVADGAKGRGGSGGSSGDATPPKTPIAPTNRALAAARTEEDRIRAQRFESAFAVDRMGRVLLQKDGGKREVSFTRQEMGTLRGGIGVVFTHNHPDGWRFQPNDPRFAGNSFSKADLQFACTTQLSELRVVTPTRRYYLRPPAKGWSEATWNTEMKAFYEKAYKAVQADLIRKVKDGIMTLAEKDAATDHEILLRVASKFGMSYGYTED